MKRRSAWKLIDWNQWAVLVAACVLAAHGQAVADAVWREDVAEHPSHWPGALTLYSAVGGLLGILAGFVIGVGQRLTSWLQSRVRSAWQQRWLGPAYYGVLAVLASYDTAWWAFSGKGIGRTVWASLGPPLVLVLVLGAALVVSRWVLVVAERPRSHWRWVLVGLALLGSLTFTLADQLVLVSLYPQLHSYQEALAFLLLALAWGLALGRAQRLLRSLIWSVAGVCSAFALSTLLSVSVRDAIDRALTHAWVDPVYAGRMLRRAQELETFLKDPAGYSGIQMGRLERLRHRYQLGNVTLADQWLRSPATPEKSRTRTELVQGGLSSPNVLVFYVDTLRNDIARDPEIMPNLNRFSKQSLDFRHAYATGSDTLRSLPGLTGGTYFVRHTHGADLCELAAAAEHVSSLFIAQSARVFLEHLRPSFRFEHEHLVRDYPEDKKVWGYGADQPTASKIVDAALARLEQRPDEKFFMWLFHFDQHNWRELNEDYIVSIKNRFRVPEAGTFNSRYRAVASAIDAEFGRLLRGLDELGRSDDTVVLVVSDHGEGLGEEGFWVHSVFLWESLVRVPLMLRVPGLAPEVVETVVSLVDVAPTLAPFLAPDQSVRAYHGEDLLLHLDAAPPQRRFPILFAAALRDELVRIGMVDTTSNSKLVVRLEAAQLEMYDLDSAHPDAANLASQRTARGETLLRELARSPVFPRSAEDFRMLKPKGHLELSVDAALPASAGH